MWLLATGLSVVGCLLLVAQSGDFELQAMGVFLALGAGACYAAYTVFSKGLLDTHPPDAVMAVVFCLGALLLSPVLLRTDLSWLAQPRGLAVALHLGLVATAVAYTLFGRGLKVLRVPDAVTLTLAEPLTAGLLGVLILGEQIGTAAWLGIGLLFAGLALLSRG